MGVNEIPDKRDSLLTLRMENLRKVQRREGEAGGGGQKFQQVFKFADGEDTDESKEKADRHESSSPPPVASVPRVITTEDINKVKKRNELTPGQLIDLEV